jgi:hypothetical protein
VIVSVKFKNDFATNVKCILPDLNYISIRSGMSDMKDTGRNGLTITGSFYASRAKDAQKCQVDNQKNKLG